MGREGERKPRLAGFERAVEFERMCEHLLTRASQANERLNAFSGRWRVVASAQLEAVEVVALAQALQRRLAATSVALRLDPRGECAEGLWDLTGVLETDQTLARELWARAQERMGAQQRQALERCLDARRGLYHALEVLRLLLVEHEMDVQVHERGDRLGLGAAHAVLRGMGWSGLAE